MATDRELAAQAEAHLRRTTVSYPEFVKRVAAGRYNPKDGSGTEWGQAFAKLKQIDVVVEPPPPPPPPTGSTKHVTYFKLGGGEFPGSHANDYEALVVAQGGISEAAQNSTSPALFYTSPQAAADGAYSLSEAQASAFLLRNTAGTVLRTNFGHPLIDPGSQPGREAFTAEIERRMTSFGADGVFHDDVQMTWSGFQGDFNNNTPVSRTTGQPYTQATWQAACAGWCQHVGGRIKTWAGKKMIFNARGYISGDGRSDTGELTKIFWTLIGGACATHLCIEYWVYTPQGMKRRVGTDWNQNWDGWQSLVAHAHSLGTNILTLEDASETDVPVYSRASALLDYSPGDLFVWAQGTDPWRTSYTKNLGLPTAAKTKSGNVWSRQFANGRVTVDPVAGTASIV